MANVLSRYPEDLNDQQTINCNDALEISTCRIQISKEIKSNLKNIKQYQQVGKKLASIIKVIQLDGAENLKVNYQWYKEKLYQKGQGR